MPSRIRKGRRELEFMEWLELLAGPQIAGPQGFESVFASDDDRREVWDQHAEGLLAWSIEHSPGERPWAWWRYGQGLDPAEIDFLMEDRERLWLEKAGVMDAEETERAAAKAGRIADYLRGG